MTWLRARVQRLEDRRPPLDFGEAWRSLRARGVWPSLERQAIDVIEYERALVHLEAAYYGRPLDEARLELLTRCGHADLAVRRDARADLGRQLVEATRLERERTPWQRGNA